MLLDGFGVNDSTVRLWRRQWRFPDARQVGRDRIIPHSDLDKFEPPKVSRSQSLAGLMVKSL